jgi:hypothetical protein
MVRVVAAKMRMTVMRKEIDILVKAAGKRCWVVDKFTQECWTPEMLFEAQGTGRFQEETDLFPPDCHAEVTGPFPGCCQQGSGSLNYHAVGQTRHFIIFAATDAEPGSLA